MKMFYKISVALGFVLSFYVAFTAQAYAAQFSPDQISSQQVGAQYAITGNLTVTNTAVPVSGVKLIIRDFDTMSTIQEKTLTTVFPPDTATPFASNATLSAGKYTVNFSKTGVPECCGDVITVGGQSQNTEIIATWSNVTLRPDAANAGKYIFDGKLKLEGVTGTYSGLKVLFSPTGLTGSVTASLSRTRNFGTVYTVNANGLGNNSYGYQASIIHDGQTKTVGSLQTVVASQNSITGSPQRDPILSGQQSNALTGSPQSDPGLTGNSPKELLANPLKVDSIQQLIAEILKILLIIAIPIIGIFIIIAGFRYVMARGNPESITIAHKNLLYVIIGAALILGCILVVDTITNTVNDIRTDYNSG